MAARYPSMLSSHLDARRAAVSLTDVLFVIAIIAFLLALLLPSLGRARELSRRVFCSNNLRQLGFAYQCYRDEYNDYLPAEGTYLGSTSPTRGVNKRDTWYNQLPPYLGAWAYKDVERMGKQIVDFPEMHFWICPSKTLTARSKSLSGWNQFHYGMNQVLDGLGEEPQGSKDTPGFYDGYHYGTAERRAEPISAHLFARPARTVLMFDIGPNSPAGTQRNVATMYQRGWEGDYLGKFHGDFANILFIDGHVDDCTTDDLVTNHDHKNGDMIWTRPMLYWGYKPPRQETPAPEGP